MERSCIWNFTPVKKDKQLPKSWEEFCEIFPIKNGKEYYFNTSSVILNRFQDDCVRDEHKDKNVLPDHATAEAVLALCQLIQLRNCYNGDWVPDWTDDETKYTIEFSRNGNIRERWTVVAQCSILFFKTEELRDEFLRNFRPLIKKLKPLYGIREGGQE